MVITARRKTFEMNKRRLYKENPQETLNEDGTRKTLKQQFE
jgi:hypothetical protein